MDFSEVNKVWEIKSLNRIGEDEAGKILEKVAKQVQPIMADRRWKVVLLSEFWYVLALLFTSLAFNFMFFCYTLTLLNTVQPIHLF